MEITSNRKETTLVRTGSNVEINETEGTGFVKIYTDEIAKSDDVKNVCAKFMDSFGMSYDEASELSMYLIEKRVTRSELRDLTSHIFRTHQYRKITVGEIISQHQPNVKLVSGYKLRNIPTEQLKAEYVKLMRRNGMLYYAERSRIESLNEMQKEVLRKLYRESFF